MAHCGELFMMSRFAGEEQCGARLERASHQTHARPRADGDHFMPVTFAASNERRFESACGQMAAQALRDLRGCLRFAEVHCTPLTLKGVGLFG